MIAGVTVYARADFGTPAGMYETRASLTFWSLLMAAWGALNLVFVSGDVFTLYVALELLTFAGVPLVYSRGRGIDGLLPESLIGYGCDPGSPADVAAGIVHVIRNEAPLKKGIARAQADHLLDPLRGEFIGRTYVEILTTLAG